MLSQSHTLTHRWNSHQKLFWVKYLVQRYLQTYSSGPNGGPSLCVCPVINWRPVLGGPNPSECQLESAAAFCASAWTHIFTCSKMLTLYSLTVVKESSFTALADPAGEIVGYCKERISIFGFIAHIKICPRLTIYWSFSTFYAYSTFVCGKPLDIFRETLWQFLAMFVAIKQIF